MRWTHVVPLSVEALHVISELGETGHSGAWVFPSRAQAKRPHVTNMAGSLRRVRRKTSIPGWTVHDFRTTFRTHAVRATEDGGLGVPASARSSARPGARSCASSPPPAPWTGTTSASRPALRPASSAGSCPQHAAKIFPAHDHSDRLCAASKGHALTQISPCCLRREAVERGDGSESRTEAIGNMPLCLVRPRLKLLHHLRAPFRLEFYWHHQERRLAIACENQIVASHRLVVQGRSRKVQVDQQPRLGHTGQTHRASAPFQAVGEACALEALPNPLDRTPQSESDMRLSISAHRL